MLTSIDNSVARIIQSERGYNYKINYKIFTVFFKFVVLT